MKIYLAGQAPWKNEGLYDDAIRDYKPFTLESFYYANEDTVKSIPLYGDFLLDSGAFTFMVNNTAKTNWNAYIEEYAQFIVNNKVDKYFELDIDSVVGYEKVLEYRKQLETLTKRPCIPVWHKSRGHKEFLKMCDEYGYVAIGGIVSGEITKDQYRVFPQLIREAHGKGAKIHGLGFTNLKLLPQMHFDSVDSTAWTAGNRFGHLYKFNGRTMEKIDRPAGTKFKDTKMQALNNYVEWLKFQKYAEVYL